METTHKNWDIACTPAGIWSQNKESGFPNFANDIIIFSIHNESSRHTIKRNVNFMVLGERPSAVLDAQREIKSILWNKLTQASIKFHDSQNYNEAHVYLSINTK